MAYHAEYLAALQMRDSVEKANKPIYDAYTKLADRLASSATTIDTTEPARIGTPTTLSSKQQPQNLQADLVEAQRNRNELKIQLASLTTELETLQQKSKLDSKKIASLTQERNSMQVKLRDREEEIRGKTKLLENVHDETVSLTIQLNMAEQREKKLQDDNEQLVKRWMDLKGEEANAMNDAFRLM